MRSRNWNRLVRELVLSRSWHAIWSSGRSSSGRVSGQGESSVFSRQVFSFPVSTIQAFPGAASPGDFLKAKLLKIGWNSVRSQNCIGNDVQDGLSMRTEALWATFGRQVVVWVNRHLGDAL